MSGRKPSQTVGNVSKRKRRNTPTIKPPDKSMKLEELPDNSEHENALGNQPLISNSNNEKPIAMDTDLEKNDKQPIESPSSLLEPEENDNSPMEIEYIPNRNSSIIGDPPSKTENNSNETGDKSSENGEDPDEPEDKPIENEKKSDEIENKSSEIPIEPKDNPTEIEEKSDETEVENGENPIEPENNPTEIEETEAENGENPIEPEDNPTEIEETEAENGENPTEIEEKSDETENKSSENGENPVEPEDRIIESEDNSEKIKYSEYYMTIGYALRKSRKEQYYAKDGDSNEMYFKDPTNDSIYAYTTIKVGDKEQRIEYPAVSHDETPNYIYERGNPRYPENLDTGHLIFPIDPKTKEEIYLPDKNGQIKYPKNKLGSEYYRKDSNKNEIPIPNYMYAKDAKGSEFYPKYNNGDEYYLKIKGDKSEIGAHLKVGKELVQFYARKQNGDEFYPRNWTDN